jgi:hypothetical protein
MAINVSSIDEEAISFDMFVQSCISLKRMTEVFKKYDDDRDGCVSRLLSTCVTVQLTQYRYITLSLYGLFSLRYPHDSIPSN